MVPRLVPTILKGGLFAGTRELPTTMTDLFKLIRNYFRNRHTFDIFLVTVGYNQQSCLTRGGSCRVTVAFSCDISCKISYVQPGDAV